MFLGHFPYEDREIIEGTEFEIECDIIISAIGQMGDFTGIEAMDGGNGFVATDGLYRVKSTEKHFAGGDIIRPHLLTTASRRPTSPGRCGAKACRRR